MVAIDPIHRRAPAQMAGARERGFALTHVDRKFLLFALIGLLAVRVLAIFWLPLIDPTEARYAEIARKMLETGDWITPQFDYGVPFWGKPPLHTWLSALGMKIFGVGPFGARVFIFTTSLGVLWLIFDWVRQHRGRDQALAATTVLVSTVLFFGASAFVMTDMVMTLGTTLSMVAFYNCLHGRSSRRLWGRLFFVGIAIGLLAKGPVALVITLIPLVLWLPFQGRWRMLRELPWISGIIIAAALTVPWYVAAEIKTPGFLHYFIIGEHFERFVTPGWQGDLYGSGHAQPKGIIWIYALGVFLPWTLFAAGLLPRARWVAAGQTATSDGLASYLALWAIAPLLLFTPAANILAAYVLPGLPAAAVLFTTLWAKAWGAPGRWTRIATVAAVGGTATLFLVVIALSNYAPRLLDLKTERELVAIARQADPGIQFTYWGDRSYSAEFYTHGAVRLTRQSATLEELASNGVRDAVAVGSSETAGVAPFLGPDFERIGQIGQRVLFIEISPQGNDQ